MIPLPIDTSLPDLVAALARHPNAVLVAPPGAGKTTRVPPAMVSLAGPAARVIVLQPRRVAARAAARRVALEQRWSLGDEVGYHVRFDRRARPDTRLVFMTEGLLIKRLQADPFLEDVACVIFDEIHERSVHADLALALTRQVQRDARADLRIVAMSATLNAGPLAEFLGDAPVVHSEGRTFPVEVMYEERSDDRRVELRAADGIRRMLVLTPGNILAFLPGAREIHSTIDALGPMPGVRVVPLYGDLSSTQQDDALEEHGMRTVVVSTNVAETSLTIPGVTGVVDTGLAKILRFDLACGLDRLELSRISAAAADQRAGRAGRVAHGACLRLWTAAQQRGLDPFDTPEVLRVDLSTCALELLVWGETDLRAFPWLQAPREEALDRALETLRSLGAIDDRGVTPMGHLLARLPFSPRLARIIVEAHRLGAVDHGVALALDLEDRGARRPDEASDVVASVKRWTAAQRASLPAPPPHVRHLVDRAHRSAARVLGDPPARVAARSTEETLGRALAAGFADRVALRSETSPDRAVIVGGRGVMTPAMLGADRFFVCLDVDPGRRGNFAMARARRWMAVDRSWLPEAHWVSEVVVRFDAVNERVEAVAVTRYLDLVVDEKPTHAADEAELFSFLRERALHSPERAFGVDRPEIASLLTRMRFLARHCPELCIPEIDATWWSRIAELVPRSSRSFADLRRLDLCALVRSLLSYEQWTALHREAPERVEVPSGSRIRIKYDDPEAPVLPVRIQECFGWSATPRIANGRVALVLHLLAPNGRPQQVTTDLHSFWMSTYPEVRKELRARYPKHAWPEDPWTATPRARPGRPRGAR